MIELTGIGKRYGDKLLFEGVNWLLRPDDRVGLVGANGSGKTTILRMIAGQETPDYGQITRLKGSTVGYLPQEGLTHTGRTVFDECLAVFAEVLGLEAEERELEARLGALPHDSEEYRAAAERYSEVHHQFEVHGGYALEAQVGTVLAGLGFLPGDWKRPCQEFSGGWQMRIALAKLLLARPNVLLLDEPTNHLDLQARNWLEEYLQGYPHAFVIVSHDRYLLNVTARKTVELWNRRLHSYSGNYDTYLRQREQRREQLLAEYRNQQARIHHLETFVNRFRYTPTKAAHVQTRIKQLEKIERIEIPPEGKTISFRLPPAPASGRQVAEVRGLGKAYGEKRVFEELSFTLERGDRVALVGANGAGKSTLIRLLAGAERPTAGQIRWGYNVRKDYFAQDQYQALEAHRSLIDDLGSLAPAATQTYLRTLLGCFLFRDEDVFKPIGVLSGGERNRYAIARLLLIPANFLLLDEPTNHLDLRAKDVLLEALGDFAGTLVFVSHDRYFIDGLATRVFEVGNGRVTAYAGNYEDYLRQSGAGEVRGTRAEVRGEKPAAVKTDSRHATLSTERAALEALTQSADEPSDGTPPPRRINPIKLRKMRERVAEIEEQIGKLESEVAEIQQQLASATSYPQSQQLLGRLTACDSELESLYAEWEELQSVL
jgi:ATP-binding cassette subfamily F protein 3